MTTKMTQAQRAQNARDWYNGAWGSYRSAYAYRTLTGRADLSYVTEAGCLRFIIDCQDAVIEAMQRGTWDTKNVLSVLRRAKRRGLSRTVIEWWLAITYNHPELSSL